MTVLTGIYFAYDWPYCHQDTLQFEHVYISNFTSNSLTMNYIHRWHVHCVHRAEMYHHCKVCHHCDVTIIGPKIDFKQSIINC